jgi:uncharacterized protein
MAARADGGDQKMTHRIPFHVLAKPTGAACNLDCRYCFYLNKEDLYPGSDFRMSDDVMESYIRQVIEAHDTPEVSIAWQGGEPTLMGLDFFKRTIEVEEKYRKPGTRIVNTLQTNGILLNDAWCAFFREHDFLIGLSIDGPEDIHNRYRLDKGGHGTFERVMRALRLLQKHGVEFNTLTTVHAANGDRGLDVYRFFRDEAESRYLQFIPIVERISEHGSGAGGVVSEWSVTAEQYGRFLIEIFDEWVRVDVGEVSVQIFDAALNAWVGGNSGLCIFSPTCGRAVALEHTGDLYSCDHFVDPEYKLGNIREDQMTTLVDSSRQEGFGQDKQDTLPRYCLDCEVHFACNGGCPKNRFIVTPDGEPGLNYLCAAYKAFFTHIGPEMELMADLIRQGRAPADITGILAAEKVRAEDELLFGDGPLV